MIAITGQSGIDHPIKSSKVAFSVKRAVVCSGPSPEPLARSVFGMAPSRLLTCTCKNNLTLNAPGSRSPVTLGTVYCDPHHIPISLRTVCSKAETVYVAVPPTAFSDFSPIPQRENLLVHMQLLEAQTEQVSEPSQSVRGRLRVVETNPQTDPRWESFVAHHPNGSVYHHPAWLQALEREYKHKGMYLLCEDFTGQVLGILPMHYTRGLPFSTGNPLIGRRLSSLPRTPLAGPLSVDSRATVALLRAAVHRASINPGTLLQIKTQGTDLDGLVDGLVCTPWRMSYVLRLEPLAGSTFRIADRDHRYTIKKAINKATRLGVHVRPAETLEDLYSWYRLYLETMRHNVVPARPYRFFIALWELLRPRGMMQLLLAERQEAGRRRIIAGTIFLQSCRTVSCGFNGSRRGDFSLRPNDLIYWEAINNAFRRGFRLFDFGEVMADRPELARYKLKWGSEPVRLYRYYYPAFCNNKNETVQTAHHQIFTRALWRRLPLTTTTWLSDWIYDRL